MRKRVSALQGEPWGGHRPTKLARAWVHVKVGPLANHTAGARAWANRGMGPGLGLGPGNAIRSRPKPGPKPTPELPFALAQTRVRSGLQPSGRTRGPRLQFSVIPFGSGILINQLPRNLLLVVRVTPIMPSVRPTEHPFGASVLKMLTGRWNSHRPALFDFPRARVLRFGVSNLPAPPDRGRWCR